MFADTWFNFFSFFLSPVLDLMGDIDVLMIPVGGELTDISGNGLTGTPISAGVVSSVDPAVQSDPILIKVEIVKPNLVVSVSDIGGLDDIDYLRGKVGNAVTISAIIRNIGNTEAKNVQVKLYEESTLKGTKSISSIDAGGEKKVDFRWTVPAEEVEIWIEITPQEEIDDEDHDYPIFLDLRPDLSFSGDPISFSNSNPAPGEKITINVNVRNTGGDAEDVVVKFFDGTKLIFSSNRNNGLFSG